MIISFKFFSYIREMIQVFAVLTNTVNISDLVLTNQLLNKTKTIEKFNKI
jgi:hypothetical protein